MGRLPREMELARRQIVEQKLKEGFLPSDISGIVRVIQNDDVFNGVPANIIYQYVYGYLRRRRLIPPQKAVALSSPNSTTTPSTSWLDQFFESFTLRLPIGYMDEIAKLKRALRPGIIKLEAEARRIHELETRIKELEKQLECHRCPDANEMLREENQKLKEQNTFLARRTDALSKLTAHRDVSGALVVNGKG